MTIDTLILTATAFLVGIGHTLLGPDHYLPFVAMSEASNWTYRKTFTVTAICGAGHIAGSVILGSLGLAFGTIAMQVEFIEALRGDIAAWLLLGFGFAYLSWGVVRAYRNVPHTHLHRHADGTMHTHHHTHQGEHMHVHSTDDSSASKTSTFQGIPWILFVIFVLGPCEPLVPLLMSAAIVVTTVDRVFVVTSVVIAFGMANIATMLFCVAVMKIGLRKVDFTDLSWFGPVLGGFAILVCGALMKMGF